MPKLFIEIMWLSDSASSALIQNGYFATGLEAFLVDKEVISYGDDNSTDKIFKIFR